MWTSILLLSLTMTPDPESGTDGNGNVEIECPDDLSGQPDLIARQCRKALAEQGAASSGNVVILVPVAAAAAAGIGLAGLKQDAPASR